MSKVNMSAFASKVVTINTKKNIVNTTVFWDKHGGDLYSQLNNINVPDSIAIQRFQLKKLESLSKTVIGKQIAEHDANFINELFLNGQINGAVQEYASKEETELSHVITNWMNLLNQGYSYSKGKEYNYSEIEYKKFQTYITQVHSTLTSIISTLQANNNKILGSYLKKLKELMDLTEFNPATISDWISQMSNLKGDTVEQIGKEWLKQKCPNINTIVTGAVEYRGKKYQHQGQLIQDLMLLKVETPDLLSSIDISFYMAGDSSNIKRMSLGDFIKMLDGLNGSEKHIMLTDKGYETLMKYSALNIQAKAGINQLPWNKKSSQISISDFTYEEDGIGLSSKRAFELLQSLNSFDDAEKYWDLKDTSEAYQALANYGLATALGKVLHLEENIGNQFLLTPSGFISFPERIKQLFRDEKYRAYMQDRIHLFKNEEGKNFLAIKHTVDIR